MKGDRKGGDIAKRLVVVCAALVSVAIAGCGGSSSSGSSSTGGTSGGGTSGGGTSSTGFTVSGGLSSVTVSSSLSKSHGDILSAFGMSSALGSFMGNLDDAIRRYSNPDMDGDGEVDCSFNKNKFMMDFHVHFDMKSGGTTATIADIVDNYLPDTATSNVTANNFSGYYGFGVNTTRTSDFPTGTIVFTFGGKTITYTDVQAPTLAELTAPTGRILPFIKFVKSNSGCTSACTLASVDYKWMKKDETGWTAASGSITWSSANTRLTGATAADVESLTTGKICHLGLSYDDQIGMRYFEGIYNTAGTCS